MDELEEFRHLHLFKRRWAASWALFTSADRFVQISLERASQGARYTQLGSLLPALGQKPHPSTEEGIRYSAREALAAIRRAVAGSLILSLVAGAVALVVSACLGAVHPDLPWHKGKLLQATGGVLALWGTLLAVDGPARTWSGWTAAEHVHATLYTLLLVTGGFLAVLGTLISP